MTCIVGLVDNGTVYFQVSSDYQVGESASGMDACGSGRDVAIGALAATRGQPPLDRVTLALAASEEFNAGVRRPFYVGSKGAGRLAKPPLLLAAE